MSNRGTTTVFDDDGSSRNTVLKKTEMVVDLTSDGRLRVGDGATAGGREHVTRFPADAYSYLATGYIDALREFDAWIWDATNNHIRHTSTDVGGAQFGVPDDTLTTFSYWMAAQANFVYYEGYRLANDMGDTGTAAFCKSRFQAQWTHVKASYSPQALKTGDNSSGGGKWLAYVLDDAAIHLRHLHAVADVYGASTSEGQLAIGYMVEFLPFTLNYFRDTYSTNALIDYGVSTPGGTAFKSNTYGCIYGHPGDTAYDHTSSIFEAWIADEALWLSKRTGTSAPTSQMTTALQSYAKNTWQWQQRLKTPLSTGDARTAADLFASSLCTDPNAAAKNTNTAVNGGNSFTGSYDANKKYLVAINWYYGTPVRAVTSLWDTGNQGYIALSCNLASLPGADPKYAAQALATATAYCATNGFGRTKGNVPLIGNLQDPHSVGTGFPRMMRALNALPGFDRSSLLVQSTLNTARKLIATRTRGRMTPDWSGEERNFVHDGTNNPDYGWEHELAAGGGGVQAHREQIMVSSAGLNLVQAALQFRDVEVALGSGVGRAAAIEQLISIAMSAAMSGQEAMSVLGGNFLGPISFGNGSLKINLMPVMGFDGSGNRIVADPRPFPTIQVNDTTYFRFDLQLVRFQLWIAGKVVWYVGADGSSSQTSDLVAAGKLFAGRNSQLYIGLVYGKPAINFANGTYLYYNPDKSRLEFAVGGNTMATLDLSGNLRLRGNTIPGLGAAIDN